MAITYSFNCTVKYRFSDEIKSDGTDKDNLKPKFSDSSTLFSIESNETEVTNLTVDLPNYIQGIDEGITWYISNNYTNDKENCLSYKTEDDAFDRSRKISNQREAGIWKIDATSEVGDFKSYDISIILYTNKVQTTVAWKYYMDDWIDNVYETINTVCWADDTNPTPPSIPMVVKRQRRSNETESEIETKTDTEPVTITLATFTSWAGPVDVTENSITTKTYTAQYSIAEYSSNNPFMTTQVPIGDGVKLVDIFSNAEPYHYGTGAPEGGWFMPIGEDNDDVTLNDIKIQAPENNGYSNIKTIEGYTIKGKPIQYIEKGTFPLMRLLAALELSAAVQHYELVITYCYDDSNKTYTNEIEEISFSGYNNSDYYIYGTEISIEKTHPNFEIHGHKGSFPKRLGFILTGGGGGGGGLSRYDPKSDGKENDYTSPGGGGGGGEIVCGTFDLTNPGNKSEKKYKITLGEGGKGGNKNANDASYDSPQAGSSGSSGTSSKIYYYNPDTEKWELLYIIGGGEGGQAGQRGYAGAGGEGGNYAQMYPLYTTKQGCVLCQRITGGRGGSQSGDTTTKNESLEMTLYFSKTKPPTGSENKFYIYRKYVAKESSHNGSDLSGGANVAGGNSFGNNGASSQPIYGEGGGCIGDGQWGSNAYFGIYY